MVRMSLGTLCIVMLSMTSIQAVKESAEYYKKDTVLRTLLSNEDNARVAAALKGIDVSEHFNPHDSFLKKEYLPVLLESTGKMRPYVMHRWIGGTITAPNRKAKN